MHHQVNVHSENFKEKVSQAHEGNIRTHPQAHQLLHHPLSAYISCNEGRQIDSGRQFSNRSEAAMEPCPCVKFIVEGVLKSNLILILTDLTVRFNYELKHLDTDRLKCAPTHTHPHRKDHTV